MILTLAVILGSWASPASARALDAEAIQRETGAKGALDGAVFKVSMPRDDLKVSVGGLRLPAPMGLTSWAAFHGTDDSAMVMGDVVLTEGQIDAVMDAALSGGLEVTALHNHFSGDSPRLMYMHVGGRGPAKALASAVGAVFAAVRDTAGRALPEAGVEAGNLEPIALEAVLGGKAQAKDGVLKFVFEKKTSVGGHEMGKAMGVNTWAAFYGSPARAAVAGDFAMLEPELQRVIKSLRRGGLSVVAIHQHMTGETPRILFLHYWGVSPAETLARALRAALDAQAAPAK